MWQQNTITKKNNNNDSENVKGNASFKLVKVFEKLMYTRMGTRMNKH